MRYARKQRLLNFLSGYIASNREGPTLKEIASFLGLTALSNVSDMLLQLESEGLIRRSRKWRGIEIIKTL